MTDIGRRSSIYFDTNVIIYYVEYRGILNNRAAETVNQAQTSGARLFTSELTIAECLFRPYRDRNETQINLYNTTFQSGLFGLVPLTGDLAIRAAMEGGGLGLKLIDAIHYMSALEAGCDVFVTADRKFRSTQYLEVVGI